MPEFVEAAAYCRTAEPLIGAETVEAEVLDQRVLRRTTRARLDRALDGAAIIRLRRLGKLLFMDLENSSTLALSFGLSGRLIVDGETADPAGRRRPACPRPEHVRLRLAAGPHSLELEDQLRLAAVEIDIDESRLGTDVMAVDESGFGESLSGSAAAVKSRLMDQRVIAGIGNLIADEICFDAAIDPRRRCDSLGARDVATLWRSFAAIRQRVLTLGGSHHGPFIQSGSRCRGGICPRCGVEIARTTVGGRTTFHCPGHQR